MQTHFARLATQASVVAGSVWMFVGSLLACVAWLGWGMAAGWTETIHLWPTSILTWFTWGLVVLIQNSQMRQEEAIQRKLDELIRSIAQADNRLIGLEKRPPGASQV